MKEEGVRGCAQHGYRGSCGAVGSCCSSIHVSIVDACVMQEFGVYRSLVESVSDPVVSHGEDVLPGKRREKLSDRRSSPVLAGLN